MLLFIEEKKASLVIMNINVIINRIGKFYCYIFLNLEMISFFMHELFILIIVQVDREK